MKNSTRSTIYRWMTYFLVCSLLGWIFETLEELITKHKFLARGLIFTSSDISKLLHIPTDRLPSYMGIPLIPLYGICGLLICTWFVKLKKKPLLLILSGIIFFTAFEYTAALLCESAFDKKFWDYSGKFLNLQGRVCLASSLAWGAMTIIGVYIIQPLLYKLFGRFGRARYYRIICNILMIATIALLILQTIINVKNRLTE